MGLSDSGPDRGGEILFAYVTCATAEEARAIGRTLVEERLAACVNIRAHETIYRWQGVIESGPEQALLAKTTRAAWPRLRARVRALHSYDLPCIVALPVLAGDAAYLDWIAAETQADAAETASGSHATAGGHNPPV